MGRTCFIVVIRRRLHVTREWEDGGDGSLGWKYREKGTREPPQTPHMTIINSDVVYYYYL
jgi:hypothetical protein